MPRQIAIAVTETSQIGEARRAAVTMADEQKLGKTESGRVAIVATELATNLARYAQKGVILLRADADAGGKKMVEILAVDSGPGFDSKACMVDGYSTGGTPGHGLGAVIRLASAFDFYTSTKTGSVIMAQLCERGFKHADVEGIRYGCVSQPDPREIVCGDAWHVVAGKNGSLACIVADGLGHGVGAAEASEAAVAVFADNPFVAGGEFFRTCHQRLTSTRGAAVAVAQLDLQREKLHYTGVGNIAGTLLSNTARRGLFTHNGTVGLALNRSKTFEYSLVGSNMLVMCSDGLQTRWNLDAYPGLTRRHPALTAAILHRDYYRTRDDVTVVAISWGGASA